MKLNYLMAGLPAAAFLLLTGCIDDTYDLSDIDTTTEIKVNDLTIPVNLGDITLDNVIELKDEGDDQTIYIDDTDPNARFYAVRKTGDFSAKPTSIGKVSADAPAIEGTRQVVEGVVDFLTASHRPASTRAGQTEAVRFTVEPEITSFEYDIRGIDKAIYTINEIGIENSREHKTRIRVEIGSPDIDRVAGQVVIRNLKVRLPEHMTVEVPAGCSLENGMLSVGELTATPTASGELAASFEITVTGMKFDKPVVLKDDNQADVEGHFMLKENLGIESADMYVVPRDLIDINSVPKTINFHADYVMDNLLVDRFSGKIKYDVDIDDIQTINLSDIPKFLKGEETDIKLFEPRLTLTANNPVGDYNVGCRAGLTITPERDDFPSYNNPVTLDAFEIGHTGEGPYTIEMGPRLETKIDGYHYSYAFPGLSDVLSGPGLPQRLKIDLESAGNPSPVIEGNAVNFPLGDNLDQVDGSYTFFTPLSLCDGSTIVYTQTEDGWSDGDLDKIKVERFKLSAVAVTDIPCEVQLTASLIGEDGKPLPMLQNEMSVATIPANANAGNGAFVLQIAPANPDEPFTGIDGITFTAKATQKTGGEALSPDMNIKLSDIRINVTGSYTTDF